MVGTGQEIDAGGVGAAPDVTGWHEVRALGLINQNTSVQLASGRLFLYGWSLRAGADGSCDFFDGSNNTGEVVGSARIDTKGESKIWFGAPGVMCVNGLYAFFNYGTLYGCVYVATRR